MLRRIPPMLRRAVVVAVLVAVSASVYQSWSTGVPGAGGWVQTEFGPLGPADRNLLEKVRQAGLWEGPTSQQAEQRAIASEVKEVGRKLATEHADLDEQVRDVANQLGVLLPNAPSAQQNAWMDEITRQTGSDYDRVYVQRVREAHAQILPAISEVRATTQNDLVREFAVTSHEFVNRHHGYLESTGLVDYSALPHRGPGLFGGGTETTDLIVPFLVFVAALLAAVALFWALRNRPTDRRERLTLSDPGPRLPDFTPMAAIPGPRRAALEDTGPIPVFGGSPDGLAARVAADDPDDEPAPGTDTGSHRAVTDTGSRRAVSSTGSHRLPRSRARHSTRR
ncbi:MAG: DUF4142 domain-containing protein [Actinomycetes bacterium]